MFKHLILIISLSMISLSHADQNTVYIGLDADMSAVAKTGGIAIQRGAEIAIHEINQAGGLLGKQLALMVKDHRGNPARGIANIEAFAKMDNLLAVLGGVHTPVVMKELPLIHQYNLIYLDPWAAGTPIVDNNYQPNYVFRVSIRDAEAGKVFVDYAKSLNVKKLGLLLEQTGWGRSNEASINKHASLAGLDVVATEWVNWGQKDLSKALSNLKEAGSDTIIMVTNAPEGAIFTKQLINNNDLKAIPIIAHWGIASGEFVKEVGLENLNQLNLSVLQTYSFAAPTHPSLNTNVISLYQSLFDDTVTAETIPGAVGVAHAYDLVHLLALAIKQAKTFDSSTVRDALEKIPHYHGLVKHYQPPFTEQQHDALLANDYMMSRFNKDGWLVPIIKDESELSHD